jgi:hypothetical protein
MGRICADAPTPIKELSRQAKARVAGAKVRALPGPRTSATGSFHRRYRKLRPYTRLQELPAPHGLLIAAVFGTHLIALFSATSAVGSDSNLGGLMLNYFREAQEARFATPARRMYGYVSAGIVVAVMAMVFAGLAPIWISWTTFAASCVLDAVLTRRWISEDALQAYRREYPG